MVDAPVEIEHIDHITAEKAVDDISNNPRVKKRLGDCRKPPRAKYRLALPDEERQRDESEDRERPDLSLEHPPRAPAVLDIGEVEEVRNNLDYAGASRPPQITTRQLLCDSVDKNKVRDNREQDEEALHCTPRSIALWHSMHVSTNGWLMSRGLRMSCPHEVQTP